MADPTFQVQYRAEQIMTFEQRYSQLRVACTQESVIKGGSAVFQVSGSGNASAVTRGANGLIPYQTTDNTQYTVTLREAHAPFERTGFNIFATQGDMKKVMQEEAMATLNRDIDDIIIDQLDTATLTTGAAVTASLNLIEKARVILATNDVETEDEENMFGIITPAFASYLRQIPEFSSKDYVSIQPWMGPARRVLRWAGINWIVSNRITGIGTASESCYLMHKRALGHAANSTEMDVRVGYDEKQDLSWSRATLFHGAKLLQSDGIVKVPHDGSAYVAA
jgi:hypothetical protein